MTHQVRLQDSLWATLLDLVAAKECGGCGRPPLRKAPLCGGCFQALSADPARRAVLQTPGAPRTYAAALYDDPVRTMLIHFKERARGDLARPLGMALARAVAETLGSATATTQTTTMTTTMTATTATATPAPPLILVPMPSTRSAVRRRGVDTTAHLARSAAKTFRAATGTPVRTVPALRHIRRVADQAGLDRAERAANLAGALGVAGRWRREVAGADVVLVDDIATTGATLAEAARAVRAGGATVVGAAAVAAARVRR